MKKKLSKNWKNTSNHKVTSLGVKEIDVYDIEVEGNHNFFGNDILLHNSVYLNFNPIVQKYCKDKSIEEQTDLIIKFADTKGNTKISEIMNHCCDVMNAYNPSALSMDREAVCDAGAFAAKKKYTLSIVDNEGQRLVQRKHKVTGLDSKRAVFSKKIRDKLNEAYRIIMYEDEKYLQNFVQEFKKEFMEYDMEDKSQILGVNNIDKFKGMTKGIPWNVKAANAHNRYIEKKGLQEKITPIMSGTKIKIIRLIQPNPTGVDTFAYEGDWKEDYGLDQYLDHNMQFEKSFLEPLKNLTDKIGVNIIPRQTYDIF